MDIDELRDDFKGDLRRARTGILARSRKATLPGFQSQSIFNVVRFFFNEVQRHSIQVRATSVSFHFLMATFPALLVLFTMIPYLPIAGLKEALMEFVNDVLPEIGYTFVQTTVEDIVTKEHGGLLSIGILLSLYYSSRGVVGILNAFDKAYPSFYRRRFVRKTLVSFKIMFMLLVLVMASIAVIALGAWGLTALFERMRFISDFSFQALLVLRWVVLMGLYYIGFSMIYYYGPAITKRWNFFSPGSALAAVLSLLVSLLFSFIVNQFGQLNKLYGSIGALIILMLWIYWNSMILLVGFELNASIEVNKQRQLEANRKDEPDDED